MPSRPRTQTRPAAEYSESSARELAAQMLKVPQGHIGPVALPGSGRLVWWTGRVAIGLRHQPRHDFGPITQSGLWIQRLLLKHAADMPLST